MSTPPLKSTILNNISMNTKTISNILSFTQIRVMQKWVHPTTKTTNSSALYGLHDC